MFVTVFYKQTARDCFELIESDEGYNSIHYYTETMKQTDLLRYKRFLNSSAYDEIKECEVRKYNADE